MTKIPTDLSGCSLVRALEKVGFVVKRQRGSQSFCAETILLLESSFPITRFSALAPNLRFSTAQTLALSRSNHTSLAINYYQLDSP